MDGKGKRLPMWQLAPQDLAVWKKSKRTEEKTSFGAESIPAAVLEPKTGRTFLGTNNHFKFGILITS